MPREPDEDAPEDRYPQETLARSSSVHYLSSANRTRLVRRNSEPEAVCERWCIGCMAPADSFTLCAKCTEQRDREQAKPTLPSAPQPPPSRPHPTHKRLPPKYLDGRASSSSPDLMNPH